MESRQEQSRSKRPAPRGTSAYPRKRAVTACQVCRSRRTKCDNLKPSCSFCLKTGARCIQSAVDLSSFDPASLQILSRLDELKALFIRSSPKAIDDQDNITTRPEDGPDSENVRPASVLPLRATDIISWPNFSELTPSQTMLESFWQNIQVKNPILDEVQVNDLVSRATRYGFDWPGDSCLAHRPIFKVFQDQAIALWVEIAKHYAGNPVVAGYNPLNEPADPEHTRLISWYERAEKAIREVDPDHILFFDGNTYAMDFSHFASVLPNSVYACHDYAMLGFPIPGQAPYSGTAEQRAKLRSQFDRKAEFTKRRGVPLWNGEWGPVYSDERKDPEGVSTNEARLGVLREQLDIYHDTETSWSIWLYKDIGYQGMVYASPDSPYMKLIAPFVEKKQKLGLDFWGVVDKSHVASTYEPFVDDLRAMVPEHLTNIMYPPTWSFDRQVERSVRECLMSEYLGHEFAELFEGKSFEEIDELAASFKFENCIKRDGLNEALRVDARRSKVKPNF